MTTFVACCAISLTLKPAFEDLQYFHSSLLNFTSFVRLDEEHYLLFKKKKTGDSQAIRKKTWGLKIPRQHRSRLYFQVSPEIFSQVQVHSRRFTDLSWRHFCIAWNHAALKSSDLRSCFSWPESHLSVFWKGELSHDFRLTALPYRPCAPMS